MQDGFGKRREVNPHRDFIEDVRRELERIKVPYVIENVVGAPLRKDLLLCGKMFGLPLVRHRIFEFGCGASARQLKHKLPHAGKIVTVVGHTGGSSRRDGADRFGTLKDRQAAMGIKWMKNRELIEALPPLYTRYIGSEFLKGRRT